MSLFLLKNAEVYAPRAMGIQNLLLGGGKVLWMGTQDPSLPAELSCEVIDMQGRRLLPGFIDGHVHVTGGGGESGFSTRVPALGLSRYTAEGITTVVGLLGTDDTTRSMHGLLAQVRALREEGMSAYCYAGGYHLPLQTMTGSLRGDIIAIDPLIGVGELAISDHRSSQPTLDELLRVASEVHVAGLISGKAGILHLHLGDGERGLDLVRQALSQSELPARVFHPTHVNRRKALLVEAIELNNQGCTIDITAFPVAKDEDAWSAADAWLQCRESKARLDRVTISSDGGGCLPTFDDEGSMIHMDVGEPGALIETLQELLARGAALEDFLPAITSNVASLLRLPGKGVVAQGADADLVSINEEGAVVDVLLGGQFHIREGRQVVSGTFENNTEKAQ